MQEIYQIEFNKESAAIYRLHAIMVRVAAEDCRPQPTQHSPLSKIPNKKPRYNYKQEIRTQVIKIQERTGITNKDNVQAEMTLTTVEQTALATADPAALR